MVESLARQDTIALNNCDTLTLEPMCCPFRHNFQLSETDARFLLSSHQCGLFLTTTTTRPLTLTILPPFTRAENLHGKTKPVAHQNVLQGIVGRQSRNGISNRQKRAFRLAMNNCPKPKHQKKCDQPTLLGGLEWCSIQKVLHDLQRLEVQRAPWIHCQHSTQGRRQLVS